MALVTKASDLHLDAISAQTAPQRSSLVAGEDLDMLAPCVIDPADGLVYMSNGAAANDRAGFDGFTPRAYKTGDTMVTLFGIGFKFRYAAALTPGAKYFIGATKGRIDTAATTGDAVGICKAISTTELRVIRDA